MTPVVVLVMVAGGVFVARKYRRHPEARQIFVETFKDKRALAIGAFVLGMNLFLASRTRGGMGEGWPSAIAVAAIFVAVAHLLIHKRPAAE